MKIIPAIDLKDGKCVRLLQGREEDVTVYSDDPVFMARHWVSQGAEMLHIVDLDGAFTGSQKNLDKIQEIRNAVDIPIQLGGGIRDLERIRMLINMGIDRIIIGTAAIINPEIIHTACKEFPERIIAGIDARDGKVAIKGWVEITDIDAYELARNMEKIGVWGIVYTDISRDGMLTGPNIEAMKEMVRSVKIPVIASGGVSGIEDIKNLLEIKELWGVITGKAIYSGALNLSDAIRLTKNVLT